MKRPLAYITASWGVDPTENTEIAAKYSRKVFDAGYSINVNLRMDKSVQLRFLTFMNF